MFINLILPDRPANCCGWLCFPWQLPTRVSSSTAVSGTLVPSNAVILDLSGVLDPFQSLIKSKVPFLQKMSCMHVHRKIC